MTHTLKESVEERREALLEDAISRFGRQDKFSGIALNISLFCCSKTSLEAGIAAEIHTSAVSECCLPDEMFDHVAECIDGAIEHGCMHFAMWLSNKMGLQNNPCDVAYVLQDVTSVVVYEIDAETGNITLMKWDGEDSDLDRYIETRRGEAGKNVI